MKKQELLNKLSLLCLIMIFLSALNPSSDIKASDKHLIFPIPQKIELSTGFFIPDEQMSILIPKNSTENDIFLARFLIRELSDRYGIAVKMQEMQNLPVSGCYVLMGRYDNPLVNSWLKANGMSISEKNPGSEGYLLDISPERIIIAGSDNAGAFFGLQSLRQLIDSGKGKTVQALKVTDWPEFPFRGIRLYVPGPENIAFFKRFLRDFMALYKFNKGRTRWVRNTYCYNADPVVCSYDSSPITFYAFEWVNPRFGKKIKEVNLCGTIDYQATKTNFFMPEYAPLKSNAIILTSLSKVKKREFYIPVNEPYK